MWCGSEVPAGPWFLQWSPCSLGEASSLSKEPGHCFTTSCGKGIPVLQRQLLLDLRILFAK